MWKFATRGTPPADAAVVILILLALTLSAARIWEGILPAEEIVIHDPLLLQEAQAQFDRAIEEARRTREADAAD